MSTNNNNNNNNNNPPAKPLTHHHHAHAGPTGRGAPEDDVGPSDILNIQDALYEPLPKEVAVGGGSVSVAPEQQPPQPKLMPTEQYIRQEVEQFYTAATKDRAQFGDALAGVLGVSYVVNGVDPKTVKEDMPYNYEQVRKGGFAVLRAVKVREAAVMNVDQVRLSKALARGERAREALLKLDEARDVYLAELSVSANEVAGIVQAGIDLGESVVTKNAVLVRLLAPAFLIRGGPAAQGVQTKEERARLEAAIRGQDQGQQPPPGGPPPTGTTTTVTTQTAPPAGQPGQPAQPAPGKMTVGHKSHPKPAGQ